MARCNYHTNIEFKSQPCPKCYEEFMGKYGITPTKQVDYIILDEPISPEPPVAPPAPADDGGWETMQGGAAFMNQTQIDGVKPIDPLYDEPIEQSVEAWIDGSNEEVVEPDELIDDTCAVCHSISLEIVECRKIAFGRAQGIVLKGLIEKQWDHYTKTGHWPFGD